MNTQKTKISFAGSAIYKIKVQGVIDRSWSERLGGMQIHVERPENGEPESVLIGRIEDQSALSGILNSLFEMHLTIISLYILEDSQEKTALG